MSSLSLVLKNPDRKHSLSPAEKQKYAHFFQGIDPTAPPELIQRALLHLEQALEPKIEDQEWLIHRLTPESSKFTKHDRILLEQKSLENYFKMRRSLLKDSLSTHEVVERLNITRPALYNKVKNGTLLAVRGRNGWQFPVWQFDSETPEGVIKGLSTLSQALDVTAFAKISWLVSPSPYLEGETPLERLKAGELKELLVLARSVGAN